MRKGTKKKKIIKSRETLKRKTDKRIREQSDGKRSRGEDARGGEQANSAATANGMCDTRVLLLHDAAALSPVTRELFCQSVRSLSSVRPLPTNRAVRTFALATYPRSSSDVSSLVLPREERPCA